MRVTDVDWRGMTAFDLGAVERIAGLVHPDLFEAPEVLAERYQLYRNGCFVLEIGERISGYVFSHPWRRGTPPPLNTLLGSLPDTPDIYYIHDIALLPLARKVGAASQIVSGLIKHAKASGYANIGLVAVNKSQGFWERQGFALTDEGDFGEKLLSYEPDARYMIRIAAAQTTTARPSPQSNLMGRLVGKFDER